MQLSELTFKIVFLFLPGIIAYIVINNLTEHREKTTLDFFVQSFVLGTMSYFVLYFIMIITEWFMWLANWITNLRLNWAMSFKLTFLNCIFDKQTNFNFPEILWATVLGVILSFIITYCINHPLLHVLARKMRISKRFAALDVWGHVFSSPDIEWVLVRDKEKDLMYEGWVCAFSATSKESELFLKNVDVYCDSTAEHLYYLDGLYIAKNNKDITLEFRRINNGREDNQNG